MLDIEPDGLYGKRTPKEGDDGWAQYYVVVGNNDEKQLSQEEWAPFMQKALRKKSESNFKDDGW